MDLTAQGFRRGLHQVANLFRPAAREQDGADMNILVSIRRTASQRIRVTLSTFVVGRGTRNVMAIEWDPMGRLPFDEALRGSLHRVLAALDGAELERD